MDEEDFLKAKKDFVAKYGENEGMKIYQYWAKKKLKQEAKFNLAVPIKKKSRLNKLLFSS
jgi:hypothetical protein